MMRAGASGVLGDGQRLADILALAGPQTAPLILRQMQTDLATVATTLSTALDGGDWAAIRAQTHVLISLAGTIGATRLHALAIDLNTAAHDRAAPQAAALAAPLLADLAELRATLASEGAPANAPENAPENAPANTPDNVLDRVPHPAPDGATP